MGSSRKRSLAAIVPKVTFDGHNSLDSVGSDEIQFDSVQRPTLPVKNTASQTKDNPKEASAVVALGQVKKLFLAFQKRHVHLMDFKKAGTGTTTPL